MFGGKAIQQVGSRGCQNARRGLRHDPRTVDPGLPSLRGRAFPLSVKTRTTSAPRRQKKPREDRHPSRLIPRARRMQHPMHIPLKSQRSVASCVAAQIDYQIHRQTFEPLRISMQLRCENNRPRLHQIGTSYQVPALTGHPQRRLMWTVRNVLAENVAP